MSESSLSSSPTKTLSSWWRSFKQKDHSDEAAHPTATSGQPKPKRPLLDRSSLSSTAVPGIDVGNRSRGTSPGGVTKVYNQGEKVVIPRRYADSPIFGTPLNVSIKYASVKISLVDRHGDSFVYGQVPVIIAKCSVYLKRHAREVEGIFRVSGSSRRIKVLQELFNSPPRFGKDLDWQGFTVHDAANVLRRYLNNLPEPIIPLSFYDQFRTPLRENAEITEYMNAQALLLSPSARGDSEVPPELPPKPEPQQVQETVERYESLIFRLPQPSLQLLVYLLDLLWVFAAQSDENRMGSLNLAAIFQPCILSHPGHHMSPTELQVSRLIVEFLVENAGQILRKVQEKALLDHEAEIAATSASSDPSATTMPARKSDETTVGGDSMSENTAETSAEATIPTSENGPTSIKAPNKDMGVPLLTVQVSPTQRPTPVNTDDIHSDVDLAPSESTLLQPAKHRRQHSKSLSSALRPNVTARDTSQGSDENRRSTIFGLRRQGSLLRPAQSRSSPESPYLDLAAGDEASPVPEEESTRSRWRRSLLVLLPNSGNDYEVSPSRTMSPSTWFSRHRSNSRLSSPEPHLEVSDEKK